MTAHNVIVGDTWLTRPVVFCQPCFPFVLSSLFGKGSVLPRLALNSIILLPLHAVQGLRVSVTPQSVFRFPWLPLCHLILPFTLFLLYPSFRALRHCRPGHVSDSTHNVFLIPAHVDPLEMLLPFPCPSPRRPFPIIKPTLPAPFCLLRPHRNQCLLQFGGPGTNLQLSPTSLLPI